MARRQIEGPYRVQHNEDNWEIVELVNNEPVQLRPRITYTKDKRVAAYRRLALMNRKWQKTNTQEESK